MGYRIIAFVCTAPDQLPSRESFRKRPISKLKIRGLNDQSEGKITNQVSRDFSWFQAYFCLKGQGSTGESR